MGFGILFTLVGVALIMFAIISGLAGVLTLTGIVLNLYSGMLMAAIGVGIIVVVAEIQNRLPSHSDQRQDASHTGE